MTTVDLFDPANAWQARALRAEAALDELEAQVLANETPHRTRMRLAEAEEARLSEALLSMASERDVALEEVERLREALVKAEDLAAEGVGYTELYFVKKWRMAERLEEVREALRSTPAPPAGAK